MNIFSIPFAGGSVYSMKQFEAYMPEELHWIPLEPPGRGRRAREPLIRELYLVAADIFHQLQHHLEEPYALYGHSMGALLAYLVTQRIRAANLPMPQHLFLSGCPAPSGKSVQPGRHLLPADEFWNTLRNLGGSPEEILYNKELQRFFEPMLRADFEAIETYHYRPTVRLDVPITVMIGADEFVSHHEASAWQQETTVPVEIVVFPGNHFFIFDQAYQVVRLIRKQLNLITIGS